MLNPSSESQYLFTSRYQLPPNFTVWEPFVQVVVLDTLKLG